MSKLTKEEFIKKYTEEKKVFSDDDSAIEFMEDVSDSIETEGSSDKVDELEKENKRLTEELSDVKQKYKDRFLSSDKKDKEDKEDKEEIEEKKVIDVKEI